MTGAVALRRDPMTLDIAPAVRYAVVSRQLGISIRDQVGLWRRIVVAGCQENRDRQEEKDVSVEFGNSTKSFFKSPNGHFAIK